MDAGPGLSIDAGFGRAMTPGGCYRRRVAIDVGIDSVDAGVEDDFHHFRIHLRHDGQAVTVIEGEAVRFPWATCSGASAMLDGIIGGRLGVDAMRRADAFDRFQQCTHQLELALLAMSAASRGLSRRYDIIITDPDETGLQLVSLDVNGVTEERWGLRAGIITSPAELDGRDVRALRLWVDTLDDERYERVSVLRRCLQVAAGRLNTVLPTIASDVVAARNACYAFQEVRAAQGHFIPDTVRDHSDGGHALLAEFE